MNIGLLDEQDTARLLWERVESKAWWIIPWVSEMASGVCEALESRCYDGARAAGFELFMVPGLQCGVPVVAVARKEYCRPRALAALLREWGCTEGITTHDLRERDVLIIPESRAEEAKGHAAARALAWHQWMLDARAMA